MNTRTNIVLDDELIAQAMQRAGVRTKKAAVEAALKAYVRKPDYAGLLALRGTDAIDPDYDPSGPYGLTPQALARRGWKTFEEARRDLDQEHEQWMAQTPQMAQQPGPTLRQQSLKKPEATRA